MSSEKKLSTALILDVPALAYQAFYAIQHLNAPDGRPVNAVYGLLASVVKIMNRFSPDYLFAVKDPGGKNFRHEIFPDYKATRKPMPEELRSQLGLIDEMLAILGVTTLMKEGYEADDIIASLAGRLSAAGHEVFIVSMDKDLKQLLDANVKMFQPRKDQIVTDKDVMHEMGFGAGLMADFLAIAGDASDNVPGARGIGEKGAKKLVADFGDIDNIYKNLSQLAARQKKLLEASEDSVRLSKRLVVLTGDVPVDVDLEQARPKSPDAEKLRDFLAGLNFKRLGDEALTVFTGTRPLAAKKDVFVATATPKSRDRAGKDYAAIGDLAELERLVEEAVDRKILAIDTETTGLDPVAVEMVGFSLSVGPGKGRYIPLKGPDGSRVFDRKKALGIVTRALADKTVKKIGHNLKFDLIVLRRAGATVEGTAFDTMVAAYLLCPEEGSHGLDATALKYLAFEKIPTVELIGKGKNQITMDMVNPELLATYAAEDAETAFCLYEKLAPMLVEQGFSDLFENVEMPLVDVLAKMETEGVEVDVGALAKLSDEFGSCIERLSQQAYVIVGREFNLNSPKQLQEILFDTLGLKPTRKTKTGYSTDVDVLTELSSLHELPKIVLGVRHFEKLKGTYTDALAGLVNPATGRIHASFNQTVTRTGRLSSSNPNLQNIPVRSSEGAQIREAFVAGKGRKMLSADYSQIELRVLAHLAGDDEMIRAFRAGEDIHRAVAAAVAGKSPQDVTPEERQNAKATVFGLAYGQGARRLAQETGMRLSDAREFKDKFFAKFSGVREFIVATHRRAHDEGEVRTLLGRRRRLPGIDSKNAGVRAEAERFALNTLIQGSAADLIKIAMVRIQQVIEEDGLGARMAIQVHDELVFTIPDTEMLFFPETVRRQMENVMELKIPLVVSMSSGASWSK